jgi:hypothetical protein
VVEGTVVEGTVVEGAVFEGAATAGVTAKPSIADATARPTAAPRIDRRD